jgi:single stranded DNA-binding protein (ssb)
MATFNNVTLLGNVGNVSKVTEFEGANKVVTFSLATKSGYGEKAVTQWHDCKAWNKTADVVEKYVVKGMQVLVNGELTYRTWTDKEGKTRKTTEVVVHTLQMCGGREEGGKPQNQADMPEYSGRGGDLPF